MSPKPGFRDLSHTHCDGALRDLRLVASRSRQRCICSHIKSKTHLPVLLENGGKLHLQRNPSSTPFPTGWHVYAAHIVVINWFSRVVCYVNVFTAKSSAKRLAPDSRGCGCAVEIGDKSVQVSRWQVAE